MSSSPVIQLPRLGKQKMAALTSKARSLGMTLERYIQALIEEDLALDRHARTTTFAELMGPGRQADEAELDRLVDEVRTRHHKKTRGNRCLPSAARRFEAPDRLALRRAL